MAVATAATAAEKRTSYLELFFDLVFVFAITQLAGLLHTDHTLSGWVHTALMAWLIWWAWSQTTWGSNAIDLERRPVRIEIISIAGVMLLAAIAIPEAFTDNGLWFALPYALVRMSSLGMYWYGLRDNPSHRTALHTFLPVASISPMIVLVGGALPADVRPWVWGLAVAVDLASLAAGSRGEFQISPAHFAERHALIVIIALGESVIAVGAAATELEPSTALVATSAVGFVIVAALWWDYFDWMHHAAERALTEETDPRRRTGLARDVFTLGHLPLVVGPIAFAVGVEEAILSPTRPLGAFGRVAVGTGLVLFLLGFVVTRVRVGGLVIADRLVTAASAAVILLALGPHVDALVLLALLGATFVVGAAVETVRKDPA